MTRTLYLIRGVPGAGKSTLANTLYFNRVVGAVIEADEYFVDVQGVYRFDPTKLSAAHNWCQDRVKLYLPYSSVAVSNTSTTEKEVDTYKKLAEEFNAEFVSIIVENRHGGVNLHNVPAEKVEQMRKRFSIKL